MVSKVINSIGAFAWFSWTVWADIKVANNEHAQVDFSWLIYYEWFLKPQTYNFFSCIFVFYTEQMIRTTHRTSHDLSYTNPNNVTFLPNQINPD